jgi:hypothetical protein
LKAGAIQDRAKFFKPGVGSTMIMPTGMLACTWEGIPIDETDT